MRIAIYVRVSTQKQAQVQTIEQQLERLKAYIEQQGLALLEENIFRDDGYSGAGLNRPGLDRLRDKAMAGEIDQVLLTAPDRLARNYVHQMVLLEEFEKRGCQVTFIDRPMSQDPHDQLVLQIRGAVAEYERTLIAERMRRGRQSKYRAGKLLPWSTPPYGVQVDPDHPRDPSGVRIDEAQASVIREAVAYYLEDGTSLYGVVKHLHELGIPSPKGDVYWTTASVRGMMTHPVCIGKVFAGRSHVVHHRGRRSATHPVGKCSETSRKAAEDEWILVVNIPSIISQEQYEQVKAKLSHNQQFARRNNTKYNYLLRGMVSCGVCNLACTGRHLPPNYWYYTCQGKATQIYSGLEHCCPARFIPAAQLDELVWKDLCGLMTHPETIKTALQRAQSGAWLPQELQARVENLRKGRTALENQLNRLTEAYLNNVIPLAEYQHRRSELEHRLAELEEQEKQLTNQVDRQKELAGLGTSVEHFCKRVQTGLEIATFEQKRKLVELLIDRVVVKDGDVEIRYVIPTSLESEHVYFCHLRKDHFDAKTLAIQFKDLGRRYPGGQPGHCVGKPLAAVPSIASFGVMPGDHSLKRVGAILQAMKGVGGLAGLALK